MQINRLRTKTGGILNFSDYKKPVFKVVYIVILAILFIAVLTALIPPLWLFISGFKDASELESTPYHLFPEMFSIAKIAEVWKAIDFGKYFVNTLIVVVGAVLCSVVFNGLLAYAFAIIKPKGHKFFFALVMLGYMIPAIASIVPLYKEIMNVRLLFDGAAEWLTGYAPLWLIFGANAFYLIMFKNYFESLPKALFEAARIDGCSKLGMFFKVVVPLSRPIIGVVAIFTMTAAWSDFLLPYLILQDDSLMTVMVKIYNLQATMGTVMGFGPDRLLMVLTISILPQIVLFALFQRQITANAVSSGIKE
ncbi:MAG: carbohydrate ABC transporter permease [Christensenellaceae bacterium]|jgi:multiple sugar transport system permease protein|nr:carbohydrate ABC transporter permease [Christensenellaceae bacterium]